MTDIVKNFMRRASEEGLTSENIDLFQKIIYNYYREHERNFPWRETNNPYYILVSEIMLQQTQAERVIQKYKQFIKSFPDVISLANAPFENVLKLWQGLGYNRRALSLKKTAEIIVSKFNCEIPSSIEILETFPGIGKATASEISSFAFNKSSIFIETNIRRVFIYFFFPDQDKIKDSEILPYVEKTLDKSNPREWYYALMDYGVMLRKKFPELNKKSAHYQKQAPFKNSNRQIRGLILKTIIANSNIIESELVKKLKKDPKRIKKFLIELEKEGFITRNGNQLIIQK